MSAAPVSNDYADRLQQLRHKSAVKGFLIHATVFALTISGLLVINILTNGPWWVQWPLIGWGLGLAGHAYLVYRTTPPSVPPAPQP
jgi:hypothetical protein